MKLLEYLSFGMFACIISGAQCGRTEVLVEAGSQAVLPCKNNDLSHHNPTILWTKDNGTVWRMTPSGLQYRGARWSSKGKQRIQCPHFQFPIGDYSLQINKVTEKDGGLYVCRVKQVVRSEVMLRIIRVSVSPLVPTSGKNISLTCGVTPRPDGVSVQWMLNQSPFVPQQGNHLNKNKSILIEKATMSSSGNWTCVVKHNGLEGRALAALSVKGIIQPLNDNTKLYAAIGSAATLPCVFSSGLTPLNSTWEKVKQGSPLTPAVDHFNSSPPTQLPWDKSVTLNEVSLEDEGRYRCAGTIEGQRINRTMQLVVAKIVLSKTKSSVMLTCQLGDTSEVTKYEWVPVMYDHNGTESEGPVYKGKTVSLNRASGEKWSQWTCCFYGGKGLLGNVTYHIEQMSGLFGQESSGVSRNTAAIIGLSFLMFALLLILVQIYKNHERRKRIFQYPALEAIVHTVSNEREERERNRVKE